MQVIYNFYLYISILNYFKALTLIKSLFDFFLNIINYQNLTLKTYINN